MAGEYFYEVHKSHQNWYHLHIIDKHKLLDHSARRLSKHQNQEVIFEIVEALDDLQRRALLSRMETLGYVVELFHSIFSPLQSYEMAHEI